MYVQFVTTYQYVKFSLLLPGCSLLEQHDMMGPEEHGLFASVVAPLLLQFLFFHAPGSLPTNHSCHQTNQEKLGILISKLL